MSSTTTQNKATDKKTQKVRKVKKEEAPVEPAPELTPAEEPKNAKSEKTEEKATKRTKSKASPAKEEATGGAAETKTDAPTQPTAVTAILMDESFENLLRTLDEERQKIKQCINGVREMKKQFRKLMRDNNKKKRRDHKGGNANKSPSGFAQPCKISDDLCTFLGVESGTLVPRTTVTKEIIKYIKDNGLQNEQNRKKIEPDATLRKLVGNAEDLTFFNLQVHLNPHFPRKAKKEEAAAATAAA